MRILTVCSSWRVFGAERMSLNLLEGFQRAGHEQVAVTSTWTDGEFSRCLAAIGIPDVKLPLGTVSVSFSWRPILWTADMLLHVPSLWLGWTKLMRTFQPDIMIVTNPKQGLLLYPWLKRQPSFLIEHSQKSLSWPNRRLYQALDGKLACFVSTSRFMRGHLAALGVKPDKVKTIYNCVMARPGLWPQSPLGKRARNFAGAPFSVGIAGQIAPHKGHDCLLEATSLLAKRGSYLEIKVFGEGPCDYVSILSQKVSNAGLDKVWQWMGYERNQDKIYGAMDICVVPSVFDEPFGMVAAEASSYGIPVIASRRGGLPEIIVDGVTGFLVEPNSPVQLADKIQYLIEHPDKAYEMGTAGRERVLKEFTVEKMVAGFELLFDKIK